MQPGSDTEINKRLQPEAWVDNYADALFGYALQRVHDVQYAEDIVQSVFLSAWKARETYSGEASEKTWLYAICKNKIIDFYRRNKEPREESLEESLYFNSNGHWTESAAPLEWGKDIRHPVEEKEFFSVLDLCTRKLKKNQQTVFAMKYLDEMPAEEICRLLEISPSNYWVLIHRAKLHVRACLEKNWLHLK